MSTFVAPPLLLLSLFHFLVLLLLQLREERGEQWQARWFEPAPDMQVLPGEEPADVVPLWRWNGKYSEQLRNSMPIGSDNWQGEV